MANNELIAAYKAALIALRPKGIIWEVEDESVESARLDVIAEALADMHTDLLNLINESDHRTTMLMLKDWESDYGLKADGLTYQERMANLTAKVKAKGGQSITYFRNLIESLGYKAEIIEHTPFVCGLSVLGSDDELGDEDIVYHWHIKITEQKVIYWRCGASECGDAFAKYPDTSDINELLNKYKPAHSVLHIGYNN